MPAPRRFIRTAGLVSRLAGIAASPTRRAALFLFFDTSPFQSDLVPDFLPASDSSTTPVLLGVALRLSSTLAAPRWCGNAWPGPEASLTLVLRARA